MDTRERPAAAVIVLGWRMTLLQAWRILGAVAELSAFATASRVLHPALIMPFYVFGAAANAAADITDPSAAFGFSVLIPVLGMFGFQSSIVGLNYKKSPGAPIMLATLMRFIAWVAMAWWIDWQEGLHAGWGTLGRPMGRQVLLEQFVEPSMTVAQCVETVYKHLRTQGVEAISCSLETAHMSAGSAMLNAFLLGSAVATTLLYLLGTVLNLLFNSGFRRGEVDDELRTQVDAKHKEIQEWAEANQKDYLPVEQ